MICTLQYAHHSDKGIIIIDLHDIMGIAKGESLTMQSLVSTHAILSSLGITVSGCTYMSEQTTNQANKEPIIFWRRHPLTVKFCQL